MAEHVEQSPSDWNEYLDAVWAPRGYPQPPGQAPLQRKVRWFFEQLGLQPREVCASNLIFGRSTREEHISDEHTADKCWPTHEWIMRQVKPSVILCMGNTAFNYITEKKGAGRIQTFPAGHANWECRETKLRDGIQLISVPHLSLYHIDHHPEAINWVREVE